MSIGIDAHPTAVVTAVWRGEMDFPDKEGQILSDHAKKISGCKGRQHWPSIWATRGISSLKIAEKSFLFHTIHSAAPTFGIDPALRQRVDSMSQQ
jgi:hypothetical protein